MIAHRIALIAAALAASAAVHARAGAVTDRLPDDPGRGVLPSDAAGDPKVYYLKRCQACHGARGAGDGPGARALKPKPGNFRDPKWQQAVTDAYIEKATVDGGPAVGKSPTMPGAPELKRKREVAAGLVRLIRSFGK
jgi:mono/diheme cytochrome c family protein